MFSWDLAWAKTHLQRVCSYLPHQYCRSGTSGCILPGSLVLQFVWFIWNTNAFSFPAPCMALSKTVPVSHQGGGFHLSSCLTPLYQAIKMPDNFRKRVKSSSSSRQILAMARAYIVSSAPGPPWKTGCIPPGH